MTSHAKKSAEANKARLAAKKVVARRAAPARASVDDRVILLPSIKPRHLTMSQIRAMVAKVSS